MNKDAVIIEKHEELLALHKALMEAKFHADPDNLLVSGSPFVADICNRVVDALIEIESQKNPLKREAWMNWLNIEKQETFWKRAINSALKFKRWETLSLSKKEEYVRCLLSPFRVEEKEIMGFIDEVESKR